MKKRAKQVQIYHLIFNTLCGIRFGNDFLICLNSLQVSSGYMGTYSGIYLPLSCNQKGIANENFRLSEKMFRDHFKHLLPGTGEERGHQSGFPHRGP